MTIETLKAEVAVFKITMITGLAKLASKALPDIGEHPVFKQMIELEGKIKEFENNKKQKSDARNEKTKKIEFTKQEFKVEMDRLNSSIEKPISAETQEMIVKIQTFQDQTIESSRTKLKDSEKMDVEDDENQLSAIQKFFEDIKKNYQECLSDQSPQTSIPIPIRFSVSNSASSSSSSSVPISKITYLADIKEDTQKRKYSKE